MLSPVNVTVFIWNVIVNENLNLKLQIVIDIPTVNNYAHKWELFQYFQ